MVKFLLLQEQRRSRLESCRLERKMIVILSLGWRKKMLVLVLSSFLTLNLGFGRFLATEKIGKLDMSGFKVKILVNKHGF